MTVHRTQYDIDDVVNAADMLHSRNNAQFIVEAIRIDKNGTSYLLREPKKEFPEVAGCQWTRESEIKSMERQR